MQPTELAKIFEVLAIPASEHDLYISELEKFLTAACLEAILTTVSPAQGEELSEMLQEEMSPTSQEGLLNWVNTQVSDDVKEAVKTRMKESIETAVAAYLDELTLDATDEQRAQISTILNTQTL
jgi:hypothetical protein